MNQHATLSELNWQQTPLMFQLANIGSEIERTISWKNKGNNDYSNKAFSRALELLTFSLSGSLSASQYKELSRIKELILDWYFGENIWHTTDAQLQKYFYSFAYAARNTK